MRSSALLLIRLLLSLPLALSCSSARESSDPEILVRVERVGLDANDMPVLLLEERNGSRWLPSWIGTAEAQ